MSLAYFKILSNSVDSELNLDAASPGADASFMAGRVAVFSASPRHAAATGYMRRLAAAPPQVLLLEGGSMNERLDAAFFWVLTLNCRAAQETASPCLACPVCLRILSRAHRDIFLLNGAEGNIKIEEVREVRSVLSEAPREVKKRVVILHEAQFLTEAAANAMLKSLEEPWPDTVFILLAPQRERLLPTLVSRSWTLTLAWPASSDIEKSDEAAAQVRLDWEAALVRFFLDGRGLMSRTGSRASMDANAAQTILNLLERALIQALSAQASGPLAEYFENLPPRRQRMADALLAEAQDSLVHAVNPTLVMECLAAHLFLLKPREQAGRKHM